MLSKPVDLDEFNAFIHDSISVAVIGESRSSLLSSESTNDKSISSVSSWSTEFISLK